MNVTPRSSSSARVRSTIAFLSMKPARRGSRPRNTFCATVRSGSSLNSWNTVTSPASIAWTRVRVGDLTTLELDGARVRLVDAREDLHERRLAGAVLADQAVHLAATHVEVDAGQHAHAEEALRRCRRPAARRRSAPCGTGVSASMVSVMGHLDPGRRLGRLEHGVGEHRGAQTVGEGGEPVRRLPGDRHCRHRRRSRRTRPGTPSDAPRARAAGGPHRGRRCGVAQQQPRALARADPQLLRAAPDRSGDCAGVPCSSRVSAFLRPGAICETSSVPSAPGLGLDEHRGDVLVGHVPPRPLVEHPAGARGQARDPLPGHELDQVAQVRADVGEGARWTAGRGTARQSSSLCRSIQSCRYEQSSVSRLPTRPEATRALASRTIGW